MSRSADYTIQGFVFQFNKTLLELLKDTQDANISVEGIVEDIELATPTGLEAIQCKYHEAQAAYTLSDIYKPVLQMMVHYQANPGTQIKYRLYAYFPNEAARNEKLTIEDVNEILSTTNQKLKPMADKLIGKVNIQQFIDRFTIEFGKSLSDLIDDVCELLEKNGLPQGDIDTLIYPNAIQKIANISIEHDPSKRVIKKTKFISDLIAIRTTAITRWTRALSTYKNLLARRKEQLKQNLSKNSRLRYFIIDKAALTDFSDQIVTFIVDFLDKYHFKALHDKTPLFCLDCKEEEFEDIHLRLHKKGIRCNNGFIYGKHFDEDWFHRPVIKEKISQTQFKADFRIRLIRCSPGIIATVNKLKCDDLFIISDKAYPDLDIQDVNVEVIAVENTLELKYILGMRGTYE